MVAPPARVEVAPWIREQVGDPGRPRAHLPPVRELAALPGEGGLWAGLRNLRAWTRDGVDAMRRLVARHGTVFRMPIGPVPCVAVADLELVEQILRNDDKLWSAALGWRVFFDRIDPARTTSDFPASFDFEPHKDVRRLLQPGFSGAAMASYVGSTTALVAPAVDAWLAAGKVSFKAAVRRLFATIADRVFLGVSDPDEAALLDDAMARFWAGSLAIVKNPWISTTWRRAQRGYRRLRDTLRAQVAERRAGDRPDLFSRVCRTAPEVGWVDDDTLVACYLGLMAAAFDTTSMAVTSMAYVLATKPAWQDRLRDEARAIAAPVAAEDLKKLELCDRVWRETLRRYPVAPDVPRRPLRDVELAGHRIPAGAMVLVLTAPLGFDPAVWTDPDRFDPDRFAPERAEDRQRRGAYLPFGAGAHACIGAQLSTMEAKAFWHTLLSRARFRLARQYAARHQLTPLGCVSGDVELIVEPA
jgi:cytochrome P450